MSIHSGFEQQVEEVDVLLADAVPPEEVCARIEDLVKNLLFNLTQPAPSIAALNLVKRNTKNYEVFTSSDGVGDRIHLTGNCQQERALTGLRGQSVKAFVRVWKVLEICYQLATMKKQATQRELFYRLLADSPDYFHKQRDVNEAIQDIVALLQCTRCSLGVLASSRGAVIGRLQIKESSTGGYVDCTKLGTNGLSIPGNIWHLECMQFRTDARYILVVEKDTVFQRLAEDKFFISCPSILITAKGFPDLATRVLLHRLHINFPNLPVVGLVDWNPAGLSIICTYKFGSARMGLEAPKYACDIKWLGIRASDLQYISERGFLPLTHRDRVKGQNLLASKLLENYGPYKEELSYMLENGKRAEIEALHGQGFDFLARLVAQKCASGDYI